MITFSTEFPVSEKCGIEDVLALGKKWLLGSPHSEMTAADLVDATDGSDTYKKVTDHERFEVAHASATDVQLGGFRYSRVERSEIEWTITVVAAKATSQLLMSLQISCEALNAITRLPKPNKPYIIKQVLEELGGGMDGEIPVSDKAYHLTSSEVDVAAALIEGKGRNRLPLVYVSARFDGSYVVDADELARWLAGMAHVVVEPNRSFSVHLRSATKGQNVYGGAIGVYWPAGFGRSVYSRTGAVKAKHLQFEVARDIRVALANRRQSSHCTWAHLKEVLAAQRLEKIRKSGSNQLDELVEALDAELKTKDTRLSEAEVEIARLNHELRVSASHSGSAAGGILQYGEEQDFYPGEIRDVAIWALQHALTQALDDSRRQHILSDLLAHNERGEQGAKIDDEVKSIFRTYTEMDSKSKARLTRLGFEISEDGKHYKAVYQGDGRYTFAISKTASDHRSGKNLASDILKAIL